MNEVEAADADPVVVVPFLVGVGDGPSESVARTPGDNGEGDRMNGYGERR